jgi:hypothetical protein
METLKITKANRAQYENTKLDFYGNVEIDAELGFVEFISISVKGYLIAKAGSGIEAG